MKSLLYATGEQGYLNPITEHTPSPLLPVVNRPVTVYAVELLARYGLSDVCVSLHHSSNEIEAYLGNGSRWNIKFNYLLQRQALGTAGAIKRAEYWLDETFIVLPAASIVDLDILAALEFHRAHGGIATLIVSEPATGRNDEIDGLQIDRDYRLTALNQQDSSELLFANTGAYIFEPEILNYIPRSVDYDCYEQLLSVLLRTDEEVYGYVMEGYWNPLTSFRLYQEAHEVVFRSLLHESPPKNSAGTIRYPYVEGHQMENGLWCGQNSIIHPSVRLIPPVHIGSDCKIGRNVEIGPGVVIGSNTIIDDGATIQRSIVHNDCYIGKLLHVEQKVVSKNLLVDIPSNKSVEIVDQLLLNETNSPSIGMTIQNVLGRFIALAILIGLSPLLLCLAFIVLFSSKGSILRRVTHIGKTPSLENHTHGHQSEIIELLHFRTRTTDDTYTTFGEWMERWELHRLPELWNVLRNELGLVGVKPLLSEEADYVTEPWQQKRFEYQAGFTGLWYTQAEPNSTFDELCITDAYFVVTHTWKDILLQIWRTPLSWIRRIGWSDRKRNNRTAQQEFVYRRYSQFADIKIEKR